MRKILLGIGVLFLSTQITAQSLNYNEKLPVDKSIRKGVLPNGLTYYIKSTDVVKDAASYYIIQNVGSILEDDNQQGLAHFLEHMAFNGTKNFKGKGILNTLQKHGAIFGKDINAYTAFDETVYNLNNIPTKDGLVDTCLLVLHDWSNYLLLTEKEIDAERGVIKEEWRTRQDGQMRLYQTSLPIMFNHSKYAKRLPIGLMSIVEGFKYKALRDFYHDWYRTDLQAIAIVGDINVDQIERKIKKLFSKIPAVKNPRKRFIVDIPESTELGFSLGMDPEISTAGIEFGIRHKKSLADETVADLKESLLNAMVTNMLSARIREKAQDPNAPFLGARVGYQSMARTTNTLGVRISPKPGKQQAAFAAVLAELVRAVKFGYVQGELDRTIKQFSNFYETQIKSKDDQPHGTIIRGIQNNYLENSSMTDIKEEYAIAKKIFASVTLKDLHETIKKLYTKKNRYLNVTGVKGKNNLTEAQAKQIIAGVENSPRITPYTEAFKGKTLVSGVKINKGSIVKEAQNKEIGATVFTLSNGAKVYYKYADKQKDKVAFEAVSYGGKSLVKDGDLPSADLMGNLIQMSGLGDYSATDLPKVLAGKSANVRPELGEITEGLKGNSTTKDVETMLQLAHLYFVKPRFDKKAYQVLQGGINNYLLRRAKDIKEKMRDGVTTTLYGQHPRKRIFNQDFVKDISFDKIKAVYQDRFANAADFDFYIVGDIKAAQLKPLLAKYIASIPTTSAKENFKDVGAQWKSKRVDEDIFMKMEDPKSNVNIAYKAKEKFTPANLVAAKALGDILQLRLTERLREDEGGVYSPSVWARLFKEPKSQVYVSTSFDCNPDLAEKLIKIVHEELGKIAKGKILTEDLEKTRTNFLKEREQAKNNNSYDMNLLKTFYRDGYNMNEAKNYESIVKKLSKKDIKKIAKKARKGQSFEIVFKPKK